jgi:hypothetical protein
MSAARRCRQRMRHGGRYLRWPKPPDEDGRYDDAARLFRELIEAPAFPEFLTLPA